MPQKKDLTGKPALMKELNIGLIKDALTQHGQATRVELAAITQISQPTVNVLISRLLEEKVVISLGMAKSTGGRKAEVYALNSKRFCIASLIVRDTDFEYLVTDLELNEETSGREQRDPGLTYLEQLCVILRRIMNDNPYVNAVTVGVPGAVSAEGEVFAIPQIAEWEKFNLKTFLEQEFSASVSVLNDINAIAVGYASVHREESRNMVYVHTEGGGAGAGIIIDGKLYPGCTSFAGEVGYMQLGQESGRAEETAGRRGKMEDGESGISTVWREEMLEKMLVNIICVLNPEKIVFGGDDASREAPEKLRGGCLKYLPAQVIPEFTVLESGGEYYFKGLGESGRKLLDEDVRLA